MPERALMPCRVAGCVAYASQGGYCSKHCGHEDRLRRAAGEGDIYRTTAYRRFRAWMLLQNPVCQRIENGQCCERPAKILHHVIDPKDRPDLLLVPGNVIMLCPMHHPGGTPGTPDWKPGIDYVPTGWDAPRI